MTLYCSFEDLQNESDVEQKLIMPLLTQWPNGLGYDPSDIHTKANIARKTIGKGPSAKRYYPDYIVVLAGLPLVVIEAKSPNVPIEEAFSDAHLYGTQLNLEFKSGINPCQWIVTCNGHFFHVYKMDSREPLIQIPFQDIYVGSIAFDGFVQMLKRQSLYQQAGAIQQHLKSKHYKKPIQNLGGISVQNEEIFPNEFGSMLSLRYQHIFSPRSTEDRVNIVDNAYVMTKRRRQYFDEIDRVIAASSFSIKAEGSLINDTSNPKEIIRALSKGKQLYNHLFLLIGAVGSGKSTFVDYLRIKKLPTQIKNDTIGVNINLNDSPLGVDETQKWIINQTISKLEQQYCNNDKREEDSIPLDKLFAPELLKFQRQVLCGLPASSPLFVQYYTGERKRLYEDKAGYLRALNRYYCGNTNKLLVLVLDNCDKRNLNEQLSVFQIVQWLRDQLKCLVFLPIRDVTYNTHKDKPPLDTVIKDYIFHIEPPAFTEVLEKRIKLALKEESNVSTQRSNLI